jgi:nucleoside-diphosphate-sugar epimerase
MATLVFGVGYVGSRLVQELLFAGREVVGIDNGFSTDRRAIDGFARLPAFRFLEGSIVDPAEVSRAFDLAGEVDSIYLLAAQSSAHPAAATPEYTESVNLQGPRIVLDELVRRHLDAPLVYASSLRVYGAPLPPEVDESTAYGTFADLSHLSKCYVEKLLEMYAATRGIVARAVRLGLTYGVAPVMKTDPRFMTAPNRFCLQVARREPVEVRTRDYLGMIHVEDAARALLAVAESRERGYNVFNAAPDVRTLAEVVAAIRLAIAERELDLEVVVNDSGSVMELDHSRPSIRSRLDGLGFLPRRRWQEGIAETLSHFMTHQD